MKRSVAQLMGWALAFSLMGGAKAVTTPAPSEEARAVTQRLHEIAADLHDPEDQTAMARLITVFTERGTVSRHPQDAWVLLTFDRNAELTAVEVSAARFLGAPSLIQVALLLHELEHLKHAQATDQAFDALSPLPTAPAQHRDRAPLAEAAHRMQAIVRILVEDESQAYRREILHVARGVQAAGGLARYLQTLPDAQRRVTQPYYAQHVAPFIDDECHIDERRLRQELVFLQSFPRRYRRYYEAALAWEALQRHVEIRRGHDGTLYPTQLLAPAAFLAWLLP